MELRYTNNFFRDLKRYGYDKEFMQLLSSKRNHIINAGSINEINGLVLIRDTDVHYRFKIKISGKLVYRIGIRLLKDTVWLACLDNNKKRFYKRFP